MKHILFFTILSVLFIGCASSSSVPIKYRDPVPDNNITVALVENKVKIKTIEVLAIPESHKKRKDTHVPRKVNEKNYSDTYMYPEDGKLAKKDPIAKIIVKETNTSQTFSPIASNNTMNKIECMAIMGEDKFIHYSKILGSEANAIKRCKMLKAMQ
jgi:hypothetical protein